MDREDVGAAGLQVLWEQAGAGEYVKCRPPWDGFSWACLLPSVLSLALQCPGAGAGSLPLALWVGGANAQEGYCPQGTNPPSPA